METLEDKKKKIINELENMEYELLFGKKKLKDNTQMLFSLIEELIKQEREGFTKDLKFLCDAYDKQTSTEPLPPLDKWATTGRALFFRLQDLITKYSK